MGRAFALIPGFTLGGRGSDGHGEVSDGGRVAGTVHVPRAWSLCVFCVVWGDGTRSVPATLTAEQCSFSPSSGPRGMIHGGDGD